MVRDPVLWSTLLRQSPLSISAIAHTVIFYKRLSQRWKNFEVKPSHHARALPTINWYGDTKTQLPYFKSRQVQSMVYLQNSSMKSGQS
jgi:hypothetical protein